MPSEAVLYVSDLELMAGFYTECLALSPVEAGAGYRALRTTNLTIWLVHGDRGPRSESDDAPAERRTEVPLKLGYEVAELEPVAQAISSRGGWVSVRSWEFGGYLRRDAADPEGNVIQLLQRL